MDCSLSGSSIHGILQAGILEWVAISFSRISSQLRVSRIVGRHFTVWATREVQSTPQVFLLLLVPEKTMLPLGIRLFLCVHWTGSQCPDTWSNTILRVFFDEINIYISRLFYIRLPFGTWVDSLNQLTAWMEQKTDLAESGRMLQQTTEFEVQHQFCSRALAHPTDFELTSFHNCMN